MILDNHRTIPIRSDSQVIIGLSDPTSVTFVSSEATKTKFLELVKPVELGLRIRRILLAANKSIVIEGDSCNLVILTDCQSLRDVGLEVKDKIKSNPRLIIHDIPVEFYEVEIIYFQLFISRIFPINRLKILK